MTQELKQCCDCRDGEHDNYDEDVRLVTVRDPESNKLIKRGYLCGEHRGIYADDGFTVKGA